MKDLYRSFAVALQDLLPAGDSAEITVPNRATRLLVVDYGEVQPGRSFRTITDTTRRFEDFPSTLINDISSLGKLLRDDKPSFQSLTFECYKKDNGLLLAEPVSLTHHAANTYELAVSHDQDGNRLDCNPSKQRELTGYAVKKFKAFRVMGFFGARAIKKPRPDLAIDRVTTDFALKQEYFFSSEMDDFLRQSYQRQVDFLRQAAAEPQERS